MITYSQCDERLILLGFIVMGLFSVYHLIKVVIRLSYGCHNGSHWVVIRLSLKQKGCCDDPKVVSCTTF